jgi:hypothetical protein
MTALVDIEIGATDRQEIEEPEEDRESQMDIEDAVSGVGMWVGQPETIRPPNWLPASSAASVRELCSRRSADSCALKHVPRRSAWSLQKPMKVWLPAAAARQVRILFADAAAVCRRDARSERISLSATTHLKVIAVSSTLRLTHLLLSDSNVSAFQKACACWQMEPSRKPLHLLRSVAAKQQRCTLDMPAPRCQQRSSVSQRAWQRSSP